MNNANTSPIDSRLYQVSCQAGSAKIYTLSLFSPRTSHLVLQLLVLRHRDMAPPLSLNGLFFCLPIYRNASSDFMIIPHGLIF